MSGIVTVSPCFSQKVKTVVSAISFGVLLLKPSPVSQKGRFFPTHFFGLQNRGLCGMMGLPTWNCPGSVADNATAS